MKSVRSLQMSLSARLFFSWEVRVNCNFIFFILVTSFFYYPTPFEFLLLLIDHVQVHVMDLTKLPGLHPSPHSTHAHSPFWLILQFFYLEATRAIYLRSKTLSVTSLTYWNIQWHANDFFHHASHVRTPSCNRSPLLGACNYPIFLSRRFHRPIYF